jgi:pilus assembly protein Flp/PilA
LLSRSTLCAGVHFSAQVVVSCMAPDANLSSVAIATMIARAWDPVVTRIWRTIGIHRPVAHSWWNGAMDSALGVTGAHTDRPVGDVRSLWSCHADLRWAKGTIAFRRFLLARPYRATMGASEVHSSHARRAAMYLPHEHGQGIVEYALMVVVVAFIVMGFLSFLGPRIANIFSRVYLGLGGL